jgi:hypothetical protein
MDATISAVEGGTPSPPVDSVASEVTETEDKDTKVTEEGGAKTD